VLEAGARLILEGAVREHDIPKMLALMGLFGRDAIEVVRSTRKELKERSAGEMWLIDAETLKQAFEIIFDEDDANVQDEASGALKSMATRMALGYSGSDSNRRLIPKILANCFDLGLLEAPARYLFFEYALQPLVVKLLPGDAPAL
jgi:hypothetical protein